jgi:transcriptional/translational regulatory protein YebC/TACO1
MIFASYILYQVLKTANGVLTSPVKGPYKGIKYLFEEIHREVQREQFDEDRIMSKLMELQLRLELEEIDQEEYDRQEKELMEHLAAVRKYKRELEEEGYLVDF